MAEHRTDGIVDLVDAARSALTGWTVDWDAHDLVIRASSGSTLVVDVLRRTSVTPAMAARLVTDLDAPTLVITDLIDSTAAETLRAAGVSFWDRRGRLVLVSDDPTIRVDTATRSHTRGVDGPTSDRPITGRAGLAVAVAFCMWPEDAPGVRDLSRMVDMSASTVSEARKRLIEHGLVSSTGDPLLPELFWAASDAWVVNWHPTRTWPSGLDWRQAGAGAAAHFGAPTVTGVPQAFAPNREALDRHLLRHPSLERAMRFRVAVAPTPLAYIGDSGQVLGGSKLVHPVVAALDLSRDARGREVLSGWKAIDTSWLPMVAPGFRVEPRPVWL